jgi:hypothetical protein
MTTTTNTINPYRDAMLAELTKLGVSPNHPMAQALTEVMSGGFGSTPSGGLMSTQDILGIVDLNDMVKKPLHGIGPLPIPDAPETDNEPYIGDDDEVII